MKRITPEQVIEAYRKTGFTPRCGLYVCFRGCEISGCGIGAMYYAERGERPDERNHNAYDINAWMITSYSASYRRGFIQGFDGDKKYCRVGWDKTEFNAGCVDGQAARKAVVKELGATL